MEVQEYDVDKLKEIIESGSPFMDKFRDLAPGSYKHSQNVATLCEAIAVELKLDKEAMKACGMLHDIGKMLNPHYFIENQTNKNPHDDLDPYISYQILTRHISDSVMLLVQKPEVPRFIIEIISQHHGNTVLQAIYKKAKDKYNGSVIEDHYRYKSSQPASVEAAILMIVDTVEATTRSLYSNGGPDKIKNVEEVVNRTVDRLIRDKQLDEMKIGIERVVKEVLIKEIKSTYHKRLDYEDEKGIEEIEENE